MRVRLTLLDGGDNYSEVYPSEAAARARLEKLKDRAADIVGAVQIEPAGKPRTVQEVLQRYHCLTAHLIAESLGYFTPNAAANVILSYIRGEAFFCEFYTHIGGMYKGEWPSEEKVMEVGKEVIQSAFRKRHHHKGYMASYELARALIEKVRNGGEGPVFASWF